MGQAIDETKRGFLLADALNTPLLPDRAMEVHLRLLAEAASLAVANVGVLEQSITRPVHRSQD